MKTKKANIVSASLRVLTFLPAIILAFVLLASCAAGKKTGTTKLKAEQSLNDEEPFVVVDEMPVFPGGDSSLLAYIVKNTKYPETAKAKNIQGKVIVRFCVTKTGSVNRTSVIKGANPELDEEALRVVKTLPEFKPGKQGGKEVSVWYMVPVTFALK